MRFLCLHKRARWRYGRMSVGGAISIYSFNVLFLTQGEYTGPKPWFTFIFYLHLLLFASSIARQFLCQCVSCIVLLFHCLVGAVAFL